MLESYSLTTSCVSWHVLAYTHTHIHTLKQKLKCQDTDDPLF